MGERIINSSYYIINKPICTMRDDILHANFYNNDGDFLKKEYLALTDLYIYNGRYRLNSKRLDSMLDPVFRSKRLK